jgi:hypothetical protein
MADTTQPSQSRTLPKLSTDAWAVLLALLLALLVRLGVIRHVGW